MFCGSRWLWMVLGGHSVFLCGSTVVWVVLGDSKVVVGGSGGIYVALRTNHCRNSKNDLVAMLLCLILNQSNMFKCIYGTYS